MYPRYVIFVFVYCYLQSSVIQAARILAVIPSHSYSHQVNYRPILIELARRGHDIVVITTNPLNDPTIKNYTEIDVGHLFPPIRAIDFVTARWENTWIGMSEELWEMSYEACDKILSYPPVRKLYEPKTKEKFDLIAAEFLLYHSIFGLAHVLDCPFVGMTSLGTFHTIDNYLGLPAMSSYPSNWEMGNLTGEHLPFWRRMSNFLIRYYDLYKYTYTSISKHNQIARKYFGEDFPSVDELTKNVSLVLMNHHEVLHYPKLAIGKVVSIGGIYTSLNITQHVPKELKKFMDDAKNGFVYVSFGSNIQSKNFPLHIKQMFLKLFSNLSQRIIWKYEDDKLPLLPKHIFISKWLPQRAILSHPNIKLFVYQGGLQSTEEAIMYGVPMVGMPILADQDSMLLRMVTIGVARRLEMTVLTYEDIYESVRDVLYNKSYKENAIKAQKFFTDRPYDSLQHAVWWIEYVIRNKGTPYHYYSIADDAWYSRYDEDVIAVLAVTLFIMISLLVIILLKLCNLCRRVIFKGFLAPAKLKSN